MNDMMLVTILVFLFVVTWIMDFFSRMTESQTRHSAVNLNKIKPDVACSNQHALPRPVINDGFSTASGEDLNNQSFLRLMDETNLIVLEKERLANELSLVQSQLTDSHLKLRQFQNVHDQLAIIKSELEEKKSVITDMTEKNLRLTDENSGLRRKVEDRDRIITSSEIEKNLVLDKERLVNELSLELEEKKRLMTDMTEKNLRLTIDDSRLRRKIDDRDRIIAENNLIELEKERIVNELSLVQSQLTDSHSKLRQLQIELATTKSELEEKEIVITDMIEKNLRLANDDSRLKRKVKDRDRMITLIELDKESLANELNLLQSQLTDSDSKLRQFRIESTTTKSELENNKREMTDMTEKNLCLTNENSRLLGKIEDRDRIIEDRVRIIIEDRDRIIASSAIEKNLIVLEKERLANQVSLLQSQLTDTSSKLRQHLNVHDELATTKSELEEKKSLITDMTVKNLRLTNANSRLRRKVEAKDRIIESSRAIEKNLVLDKERLVNELSLEIEEKKRLMTDMKEKIKNLRLTNDDSRLRRKIEDRDKIIASSRAVEKNLVLDNERLKNELSLVKTQLTDSHSNLQMLQKVHDELATTKRELEKQKNVSTDMKVKNLRLTDENSRLRPKIEASDRIIASTRTELEELQEKVQDVFAKTTSEFESKNKTISELKTEIRRLTENDSQLRRQWDRRPATTATTRETENVYQTIYPDMPPEYENPPSYGASVTARY